MQSLRLKYFDYSNLKEYSGHISFDESMKTITFLGEPKNVSCGFFMFNKSHELKIKTKNLEGILIGRQSLTFKQL